MEIISYVILGCVMWVNGWIWRDMRDSIAQLKDAMNQKRNEQSDKTSATVSFSEPMSPLEWAAQEERERIRRLNAQ